MTPDRRELFKIDARTVEIDPGTSQPIAKGMDGQTKYRFWGLVSKELYCANVERLKGGVYDLGVSIDDISRELVTYRNSQLLHEPELELGVAVTFYIDDSDRGFSYLHKDIGIWERVPESKKITMEDKRRVMRDLSRQQR